MNSGKRARLPTDLLESLKSLEPAQRHAVFSILRTEIAIHPLEKEWNTSAEAILEAIRRSSDLTKRGVRGVLAEASFAETVLPRMISLGFSNVTPSGEIPYDFELSDTTGTIRLQVKLQRSVRGGPMLGRLVARRFRFAPDCFVVETQRTRGGLRKGQSTRPYRFSEFDILAVSLYPSTGRWDKFLYTVANWLLPAKKGSAEICTYQPVPRGPNGEWTEDLLQCITWFRSGRPATINTSPQ